MTPVPLTCLIHNPEFTKALQHLIPDIEAAHPCAFHEPTLHISRKRCLKTPDHILFEGITITLIDTSEHRQDTPLTALQA